MKKRTPDKKLSLAKETLKSLDPHVFQKAAGGAGGGTIQPGLTNQCTWEFSRCLC